MIGFQKRKNVVVRRSGTNVARIVVVASVALLLGGGAAAAVNSRGPSSRVDNPYSKISQRASGSVATVPTTEIYAIPVSGPTDWKIYSQSIGNNSVSGELMSGISAGVVQNTDGTDDVAVYPQSGVSALYGLEPSQVPSQITEVSPASSTGPILLSSGDDAFYQSDTQVVEVNSTTNQQLQSYELPTIPNDSAAGKLNPETKIVATQSGVGTVNALLEISGTVYALQSTLLGAAIVNLSSGTVHLLAGVGALSGGILGSDGDIYTVAWQPNAPSDPMEVLQIDPSTLDVVSTATTGVTCAALDHVAVMSSPSDNALVYMTSGSTGADSVLFSDNGGALAQLGNLPSGIGLYASTFGSDTYFYGGVAMNSVSMLNLSNGVLTQNVGALSTPPGTDVLSIG